MLSRKIKLARISFMQGFFSPVEVIVMMFSYLKKEQWAILFKETMVKHERWEQPLIQSLHGLSNCGWTHRKSSSLGEGESGKEIRHRWQLSLPQICSSSILDSLMKDKWSHLHEDLEDLGVSSFVWFWLSCFAFFFLNLANIGEYIVFYKPWISRPFPRSLSKNKAIQFCMNGTLALNEIF